MKFLTHDGLLYFWKKIKSYIDTGLNGKQNNLGYTPVQQGTGIGQVSNSVKIGWSDNSRLKATVDGTDLGNIVFDSNLPASLPANGGNADTVDGVHAWQMQTVSNEGGTHGMSHLLTCQYSNSEAAFRLKTTEGIAVRTNYSDTAGNANYATSAGNSNTVGGYGVSKGVVAGQYGLRVTQISNYDIGVGAALSTGELYIVYE